MPENVLTTITENFVVDGVNPVNMSGIQRVVEDKSEILARVTQFTFQFDIHAFQIDYVERLNRSYVVSLHLHSAFTMYMVCTYIF